MVTGQAPRVRPLRRPDESMSLLNDLFAKPLDPGYEDAAARRRAAGERPTSERTWRSPALAVGLVALGLLLTMAVLQVRNTASVVSSERQGLIEQIHNEDARVSRLQGEVSALEGEIGELENDLLQNSAAGQQTREEVESLQATTGAIAVTGPGVVVTVDNAEEQSAEDGTDRVLDLDLRQVVNGLWAAGAEAVAINGQRITPLSAIRSAQDVIQINYRPMNAPYEVSAIGDPRSLARDFGDGSGGQWLRTIAASSGIRFDVSSDESLTLPAGNTPLAFATPWEGAP
ncbi:DUF881 domain-containing protein [Jiangella aurantiaca]|uniref:DUF881 domain-containing protein n=1 Tax=Jiangella aurantiaca TaxID=2530373 RepID=A0A4R5AIS4_9ACTN|nr:DUF881 domain-containing protein [Jiangella aurantiaca]TDD71615.1 DUF881 domain-containing protein [Jiangella aurantiaca]